MLIAECQGFMNQTMNYAVYTDIAGLTMMMMRDTMSMRYNV